MLSDFAEAKPADGDFLDVTELAGTPISGEQLKRLAHRYVWASHYCREQRVAEIACGTGPGLGLLHRVAASLEAGDCSEPMLDRVRRHYGNRIPIERFDAARMPYADSSKDVLIIFEAIYYLADVDRFITECKRVLAPGGRVLVATANKDLSDFNPSPHSRSYLGVKELAAAFAAHGFSVRCFGYLPVDSVSMRQRLLRPVKRLAVSLHLMPRTMRGKQLLKTIVFGRPVTMPAEIDAGTVAYAPPAELALERPDCRHKVIYCVATLGSDGAVARRSSPENRKGVVSC